MINLIYLMYFLLYLEVYFRPKTESKLNKALLLKYFLYRFLSIYQ